MFLIALCSRRRRALASLSILGSRLVKRRAFLHDQLPNLNHFPRAMIMISKAQLLVARLMLSPE